MLIFMFLVGNSIMNCGHKAIASAGILFQFMQYGVVGNVTLETPRSGMNTSLYISRFSQLLENL